MPQSSRDGQHSRVPTPSYCQAILALAPCKGWGLGISSPARALPFPRGLLASPRHFPTEKYLVALALPSALIFPAALSVVRAGLIPAESVPRASAMCSVLFPEFLRT